MLFLQASLDATYDELVVAGLPGALPCAGTPLSWAVAVESGEVSSRGLRQTYWLRGAALLHRSAAVDLLCPLCHALSCAWEHHLWDDRAVAAGAVLRGFRAALALVSLWMPVRWLTTTRVSVMPAGRLAVPWELARDDEAWERVRAGVIS